MGRRRPLRAPDAVDGEYHLSYDTDHGKNDWTIDEEGSRQVVVRCATFELALAALDEIGAKRAAAGKKTRCSVRRNDSAEIRTYAPGMEPVNSPWVAGYLDKPLR